VTREKYQEARIPVMTDATQGS